MPSTTDILIARLQANCTTAEAAERAVRANVEAQLKDAEQARASDWRRLSALADMARIGAREPDRATAVDRQLVALFKEIGWIEGGLGELGEGARSLLAWLWPIAEALHAGARPAPCDDPDATDLSPPSLTRPSPIQSRRSALLRPGTRPSTATPSYRYSNLTCRPRRLWSSRTAGSR